MRDSPDECTVDVERNQMLRGLWRRWGSNGSRLLALLAVQERAKMLLTSSSGQDPWTIEKWGVMSNMLPVATREIGNPVAVLILMIPNDRLLHVIRSLVVRSHPSPQLHHKRTPGEAFHYGYYPYRFSNGNSGC